MVFNIILYGPKALNTITVATVITTHIRKYYPNWAQNTLSANYHRQNNQTLAYCTDRRNWHPQSEAGVCGVVEVSSDQE
jgi:hypothetical protein